MTHRTQVAIIGGGISGLACALRLKQLGRSVKLLEAASSLGGVIGTEERNGFLLEKGPQSFLATASLRELIRVTGLETELIRADPRAPRFILRDGRLRAIPMAPPALLTTSLLGLRSKCRLLSEAFRRTHPPEGEESIADFVRRKFDAEVLDYLVGPFVSGIYAGDPEQLGLESTFPDAANWERKYGSVIRGAIHSAKSRPKGNARPTLCTFWRGLGQWIGRLAENLGPSVETGARVGTVDRWEAGRSVGFKVQVRTANGAEILSVDTVVLATPAYEAARLVQTISSRMADLLPAIHHAPVAVVSLGYRHDQVAHPLEGFGFLVPRTEKMHTLGTVWNSSLFPDRARKGNVLLTSFVGGVTDPEMASSNGEQIARTVEQEIARILRITGPPIERAIWRLPRALPQYNIGHARRIASVREECARVPGLFVIGNYFDGPSTGSCVRLAFETAGRVCEFLESK